MQQINRLLKVTPPGDNVRVMMVITYPNMLIRINSEQVTKVVGDVVDVTTKEKWVTMDATTVTKMELYNIGQVKLRDLTPLEKDTVIKAFNETTFDQNAYIEMITGNLLRVSLSDGYVVTFTSYGSQTNVIANFYYLYIALHPILSRIVFHQKDSNWHLEFPYLLLSWQIYQLACHIHINFLWSNYFHPLNGVLNSLIASSPR